MAVNPVTYAEEHVGVHEVYKDAQRLAAEAENLSDRIEDLRAQKNAIEALFKDREQEVTFQTYEALPNESGAARERAAKQAVARDEPLSTLRSQLAGALLDLADAEGKFKMLRVRIDIATARMNELGGYFAYLAACKAAQTARSDAQPTDSTSPWG